ncbi:MAG: type IV pilus twitching motility protein PilT [Acidimicrobiales bacterium]
MESLAGDWRSLDDDGRAFLARALASHRVPGPPDEGGGRAVPPPPLAADPGPGEVSGALAELLRTAVTAGASDLHLSAGCRPHLRVRGVLRPLEGAPVLDAATVHDLVNGPLGPDQRQQLAATGDLDTGLTLGGDRDGGAQRLRANLFRQSGALAAAIRIVPGRIPSLESLGLPPGVARFADLGSGLVLVTGPTGSGKSTTLAALVEQVNHSRPAHIVTIEDPVEYRYTPDRALIQQREIGSDTGSFATALRQALRQDPDVILIGELRDLETIRTALTAAETGHLVLATLHSADAPSAVNRVIDVFPADQQAQIRSQLALSLEGCVSQRLLPARREGTLTAVTEVLVATGAVRNLIREDKVHQLRSVLETGGEVGMHTFDQSLARLVRQQVLDVSVARGAADNVAAFDAMVGG